MQRDDYYRFVNSPLHTRKMYISFISFGLKDVKVMPSLEKLQCPIFKK